MKSLKKINALSLGYTLALVYFVIGLLIAIFTVVGMNMPTVAATLSPQITMLGYWVILFFPLVYALSGLIMGMLIALLYNIVAKKTGGILIDIVDAPNLRKKKK